MEIFRHRLPQNDGKKLQNTVSDTSLHEHFCNVLAVHCQESGDCLYRMTGVKCLFDKLFPQLDYANSTTPALSVTLIIAVSILPIP